MLAPPARLLLVALHALHHGTRAPRPARDLERALAVGTLAQWTAACELAVALRAERALAAALAATPSGRALAGRLGLPRARSLEAAAAVAGLPMSDGLERWARTPGFLPRARLVRLELMPGRDFMRWRYPAARGLGDAYARRAVQLAATATRLVRGRVALRGRPPR